MIPIAKPVITGAEKSRVLEVMDSGMLASGRYVKDFSQRFAEFIGSRYGTATSSGTAALHTALLAAGIKEGDKVATTPFTFIASSNSILYTGAEPVFVDINPATYNIDADKLELKLQSDPEISAVLIVHLYGLSCDMDRIMELVEKYNLILIEDCAQSHGAEYKGKRVGTFGDASIFSFYPTKNMTTGEGGIVLTDSEKIYNKAASIINHGQKEKYYHDRLGYNFRMTNIAAAVGLAQLEKLPEFNISRIENAALFDQEFSELDWIKTPTVPEKRKHVYHQYTVRVKDRDRFADYLTEKGIGYGIHYPLTVNKQPYYKKLGCAELKFAEAEKAAEEVISLPVHPALSDAELEQIVEAVKNYRS
ncbi:MULTISPECIES: DegT/DnrJ/EryC1/StrS aminotransferase family protein [unclassified Halanaerobium]|jgi:dTDP-4-amino-4,6-dideoxygalactose transaminase|uniref:DegT/DnrJ/EryC1/StrS family aminotransferase n=1 Tax=unclassified Halanaerobium TaxID=2641197 RepID=UPI000DF414DE|nr:MULTISPECIES: DegT/DnrJ/EryC1/StrS family aminotransferase [unclassified Halanaerobium]RCW43826.1 dTDP-4-amino-4,6-dideoxygalactose transaminase [Halanaerobium sp. MA284_MarDTE_T2]RCW80527.1 dTDP-4-amino-4,6-dideoxygalactose transaminase [Halanaerobium sp. DL-01]